MSDGDSGDWCVAVGLADGPVCGSGVLIDQVHVLTCAHTVPGGKATPQGLSVRFPVAEGTQPWPARVVAWFPSRPDLAVLEVDGSAPHRRRPAPIAGRGAIRPGHGVLLRQYLDGHRVSEVRARVLDRTGDSGER